MYRYLPARRLPWRQVLTGALVTALLFHLGRWAIGLYLGRATQPTAYGAAASFAALLLWLYYSAQIFLFGAEFTACLGQSRKPPPLVAARYCLLDRELAEGDTEIPAFARAGQRERYLALGDHLALRGFHRAGVRFGAGVVAEHVVDVLDAGEFTDARIRDGRLARPSGRRRARAASRAWTARCCRSPCRRRRRACRMPTSRSG